jgi:deoxyribose-phosphate aldolase
MVSTAIGSLPDGFVVASVVGFPSGAHRAIVKAGEAEQACADGAREIDMVINLAAVADGHWNEVTAEVVELRHIVGSGVVLKVIIESALWSDMQIVESVKAAVAGGADFVKTSTGYHKAGGASAHAVRVMRDTVGSKVGVKASGGVRTFATAMEMINAGADRLGTSSARAILEGAAQTIASSDS